MRIRTGIFGGTFDPIHSGHLILAEYLMDEIKLSEIWFLPAHHHIFKSVKQISSAVHRLNMLELALQNNPNFKLLDMELNHAKISYTVDTLQKLKNEFPTNDFFFLLGTDNMNQFKEWKNPEKILQLCQLVLLERPNYYIQEDNKKYFKNSISASTPLLKISSSEIRRRVKDRLSIRYMVPDTVMEYILQNNLYI